MGWRAKIDKPLLHLLRWNRDTIPAQSKVPKKGLIDEFLEDKMSSMGWLHLESVAERTRLKQETDTQLIGLKRFGKLLC